MTQIYRTLSPPSRYLPLGGSVSSSEERLVPLATTYYSPKSRYEVPGWRFLGSEAESALSPSAVHPYTVASRGQWTSQPRYPHSKMQRNVSLPSYGKPRTQGGLLKVPVQTSVGAVALPECPAPASESARVFLPPLRHVDKSASHHDHPAPASQSLRHITAEVQKPPQQKPKPQKPVRVHATKRPSRYESAESRKVHFLPGVLEWEEGDLQEERPAQETKVFAPLVKPLSVPEMMIRKAKEVSNVRKSEVGVTGDSTIRVLDQSFTALAEQGVGAHSDESLFDYSPRGSENGQMKSPFTEEKSPAKEQSEGERKPRELKWASVSTIENTTLQGVEERQVDAHTQSSELFSLVDGRVSVGAHEESKEEEADHGGMLTPAFHSLHEIATPRFTRQDSDDESQSLTSESDTGSLIEHEELESQLSVGVRDGSFVGILSTNSTLEMRPTEPTARSGEDCDKETSRERRLDSEEDTERSTVIFAQVETKTAQRRSVPMPAAKNTVHQSRRKSHKPPTKATAEVPVAQRQPDSAAAKQTEPVAESPKESPEYAVIEELEEQSEKSESVVVTPGRRMSFMQGSQVLPPSLSISDDSDEDLDKPQTLGIPINHRQGVLRRSISNVDRSTRAQTEKKSAEETPANKSDIIADATEVAKVKVKKKTQKPTRRTKKRTVVSQAKVSRRRQQAKTVVSSGEKGEKQKMKTVPLPVLASAELFPMTDAPAKPVQPQKPSQPVPSQKPASVPAAQRSKQRSSITGKPQRLETAELRPVIEAQVTPSRKAQAAAMRRRSLASTNSIKSNASNEATIVRRQSSIIRQTIDTHAEIEDNSLDDDKPSPALREEKPHAVAMVVKVAPSPPPPKVEADEVFTRHFSFSLLKMIMSIQVKYAESPEEVSKARSSLEAVRQKVLGVGYRTAQGLHRQVSFPAKGEPGLTSPSKQSRQKRTQAKEKPRKSITSRNSALRGYQGQCDSSEEDEDYDDFDELSLRERMYVLSRSRTDFELKHTSMLKSLALSLLASKDPAPLPRSNAYDASDAPGDGDTIPAKRAEVWFAGESDELSQNVHESLASIFHDFKPIPITAFTSVVTNFFKDPQSAKNAQELLEAKEEIDMKTYHESLERRKFVEYMRMLPTNQSLHQTQSGLLHQMGSERLAPGEFRDFFKSLFAKRRKRNRVVAERNGTVPATIRAKPTFTETNLETHYYQLKTAVAKKQRKPPPTADVILSGGAHLVKDEEEYRERVYCRMKSEKDLSKFADKGSRIHTALLSTLARV